jgi:hypothetical protein
MHQQEQDLLGQVSRLWKRIYLKDPAKYISFNANDCNGIPAQLCSLNRGLHTDSKSYKNWQSLMFHTCPHTDMAVGGLTHATMPNKAGLAY